MRVFVLGGTGSIGAAAVRALVARGHEVDALARSEAAAAKLARLGATAITGDITSPAGWVAKLPPTDAVIHMAGNFGLSAAAMAATDRALLDALLPRLALLPRKPRFLYTGGCWLFGATGDDVATEESPFAPLPAFAWMVPHLGRILASDAVDGIVIHPGMVHGGEAGGVFRRFRREATERAAIRVVGGEAVRWPLVHCDDLATLYALALERAPARASYLGVAIEGFPVGRIARAFARRFGPSSAAPEIVSPDAIARELGDWARGYAWDQRLSGAKARRELGWSPRHLDPEKEIASWRDPPDEEIPAG